MLKELASHIKTRFVLQVDETERRTSKILLSNGVQSSLCLASTDYRDCLHTKTSVPACSYCTHHLFEIGHKDDT